MKYLPGLGWKPFVLTPSNPAFDLRDESLLADVPPEANVIHLPIWEPYRIFFTLSRLLGGRQSAKPTELVQKTRTSIFGRVVTWIRANFFIPDPRIFWVRPATSFLENFLKRHDITTVITTGPPHSVHLIGLRLKKRNSSVRWIADFRDPWSEWGLLETLNTGKRATRQHQVLERRVLTAADEVITVTPSLARTFERLAGRPVHLISNGYDEDDFSSITYANAPRFLIRHVGIVNERCDPSAFMQCVESMMRERPDFAADAQIEFIGEVHSAFRRQVEASALLKKVVVFTGSIPHKELIRRYGAAQLLLIVLVGYKHPEEYMPGKLFEYLATGIPVLGIGPVHGDAAKLLAETQAGEMIDDADRDSIRAALEGHYRHWKEGGTVHAKAVHATAYSRRSLTRLLVRLLEKEGPYQ